jgi:Putative Ig domain
MSRDQRSFAVAVVLAAVSFLSGCGIGGGGKTTTLTLQTQVATIAAGQQQSFTAFIIHNNQQFLGATWTLTSGGSACTPACGTLGGSSNSGSSGNGDTATITYTAPNSYAGQVTITAASVENPSSTGSDTFTVTGAAAGSPSVATTSLPGGAVSTVYLAPPVSATGGTPPYSWNLQSAANTFPAGLTLNADGSITGTPTATSNYTFTVQVTDAASQSGTATLSINITAAGTANAYLGISSPGDVWQFVSNLALNQFTAINQTTGARYTGSTLSQLLPNGMTKTTLTTSTDPNLPVGSLGYGLEVPGVGATFSLGGATDKPVALIPVAPCPTFSAPTNIQLVHLGKPDYDATTSESYDSVTATQVGTNYVVTVNSYLLDGTLRAQQSGQLPPGTCVNGVITFPGTTITVAAASNGLYLIDLGPGKGAAIGSQNFVGTAGLNAALSNGFNGYVFKRNGTPRVTFVGFGPGSGSSISGGDYTNIDTDPFTNHATDIALNLTTTNANGFLQGTLTDGAGTHNPFIGLVTNNGGKCFIFGLTTDISGGVMVGTQPYAVILIQH